MLHCNESELEVMVNCFGVFFFFDGEDKSKCYKNIHSLWAWKSFREFWEHIPPQPPTSPVHAA